MKQFKHFLLLGLIFALGCSVSSVAAPPPTISTTTISKSHSYFSIDQAVTPAIITHEIFNSSGHVDWQQPIPICKDEKYTTVAENSSQGENCLTDYKIPIINCNPDNNEISTSPFSDPCCKSQPNDIIRRLPQDENITVPIDLARCKRE